MWQRKAMNLMAMGLIGDGLLTTVQPRRETVLWENGPAMCQRVMSFAAERPKLTRAFGLVELGLGLWLGFKSASQA